MGETQNKGFEATINWNIISKKDYGVSFGANIGFNKNRINSLGVMDDYFESSGWASTEIIGDYRVAVHGQVGGKSMDTSPMDVTRLLTSNLMMRQKTMDIETGSS